MKTLKELREIACLSQQEVADRAGINVVTYSRIERGKQKPRPVTKRRIAKILKVKPVDIEFPTPEQPERQDNGSFLRRLLR